MVTLEQKLSLFSKLLQQDINNDIGEQIQQMEKQYEQIVAEHKRGIDREARHIVERYEKKGEAKRIEMMSKAKMHTKKQHMLIKEKYIGMFMTKLIEKFEAFKQTPAYKTYLEGLLEQLETVGTDNTFIIYMTSEDKTAYGEWVKTYLVNKGFSSERLTVEAHDEALLGGFVLVNPDKNMRIDLSTYTHIEDHKEMIVEKVFRAVGEVGEQYV